jgi:AcrR family transcriptional regulator
MSSPAQTKGRGKSRPAGAPSTRQRLIGAAIEVVRSEGLGALTTVEITRRAGIAQPGFYKHFRNVDDCLEEATTQVLDGMRETFSAMRRGIRDRKDAEEVARHFLAVLDAVAVDKPFNELITRYRRDPSTLGRAIREVATRVRDDFVEELWAEARGGGLRAEHRTRVSFLAELVLASLGACIERVLDDPDADLPALARELADFTVAGTRGVLGRLLMDEGPRAGTPPRKRRAPV